MSKVRTRKRGKTYSYSFEIGKDPETGKRKMKEKGGFATAKEAYDAGSEAYTNWKHGNVGITSKKMTFNDFFTLWYNNVQARLRRNTLINYECLYRNYMKPYLAQKYLQDISPYDVECVINKLIENNHAQKTIASVCRLMHQIFKYAIFPTKLITNNPTTFMRIPQVQKKPKQSVIISKELLAQILEKLKERPHLRIMVFIAYYTGMRIGEVSGLTWDNVSLSDKTISIKRQVQGNLKRCYIELPKTQTGMRTIYFGDTLLKELQIWKTIQDSNKERLGEAYQVAYMSRIDKSVVFLPSKIAPPADHIKLDLVCTNKYGIVANRNSLNNYLSKFGCHPHDFRHTHATKLIEGGVPAVEVAARLGHSSTIITQDMYTHVTEQMKKKTAKITDKIL